jgi:1-phosphofructokinase family hexose kinase
MLVAGPNLAFDRIVRVDELRPGEVHRLRSARVLAGGKGVNVCRAARRLGVAARLVTFAPRQSGADALDELQGEGIEIEPIPIEGGVRAATIAIEDSGRVTVLNEPGPRLEAGDWERFEAAVTGRLRAGDWLVCIGSSPPGTPPDGYGRLGAAAAKTGAHVLVDAAGELLLGALPAHPDVASPNAIEASAALGEDLADPVAAASALVERGAQAAFVKAGSAGCGWLAGASRGRQPAPPVAAVSPIGAGDCFVAALVTALVAGESAPDAARWATAVAAASVEQEVPGVFDPERARALLAKLPDFQPA